MTSETQLFERIMPIVLEHEGGYVNHPKDPGGATKYGITQAVARAHGFDGDMRNLPLATAYAIFKKKYWDEFGCAAFPPLVAFHIFDCYVNHKPWTVAKMLQQAAGVKVDGVLGPVTRQAIRAMDPALFAARLCAARLRFYTSSPNFKTFGQGWVNRVAVNLENPAGL